MYFKVSLKSDLLHCLKLFFFKKSETGSTLEHGTWGNLHVCSQAMIIQHGSRINSAIPIKMRAVFFSHFYAPYLVFSYPRMPQRTYISMHTHTCCRRNHLHHHGLRTESELRTAWGLHVSLSQKPSPGFSVAEALNSVSLGLTFSF